MSTEQHISPSAIVTKAGVGVDGPGYLAGEHPAGRTTVNGTPVSADVDVFYELDTKDWQCVASTTSQPDGTWSIVGLNPDKKFNVVARHASFGGVIAVDVQPSRTDVVTLSGAFTANDDFNGVAGFMTIESGMPPFTASVVDPLPYGLNPLVVDGRKLVIEGTSDDVGLWESVVRVTASNGVLVDVPVQIQIQVLDPHFANVIALLGFENGIVDATGRIWTVRGSQAIVRPESALIGEKGLRVDGLDSSVDTTTQLGISGATPVTIEGFMRIASYTGPKMPAANVYRQIIFGQCGAGGAQDQFIAIEDGKVFLHRDSVYAGGSAINAKGVNLVPLNEKFHFEYSFDGTRARVFINGAKEIDVASANGWANTSLPFRIGAAYNVAYPEYIAGANADFDEIRITAGVARHTDNFTPPDKPFPRR